MRHKSIRLENISHKNEIRLFTLALAFGLIFIFTANHRALFIAGYSFPIILSILFLLIEVCFYPNIFKFNLSNISIIIMTLVLLIGTLLKQNFYDRGTFLSYILWFIFYFLISSIKLNSREIKLLINSFILGALICSFFIIVFRHDFLYTHRYSLQFMSNMDIDPNFLSCFLYTPCMFILNELIAIKKTDRYIKIIEIISFLFITFAILLTGSRATYLAVIF